MNVAEAEWQHLAVSERRELLERVAMEGTCKGSDSVPPLEYFEELEADKLLRRYKLEIAPYHEGKLTADLFDRSIERKDLRVYVSFGMNKTHQAAKTYHAILADKATSDAGGDLGVTKASPPTNPVIPPVEIRDTASGAKAKREREKRRQETAAHGGGGSTKPPQPSPKKAAPPRRLKNLSLREMVEKYA
mmetsp:Transcript_17937/g.34028  ORF Transcript_17937/g.34028 Transcript_17937/m.34028 type:complete len:190 (-) Transcript_17937:274-843(-)